MLKSKDLIATKNLFSSEIPDTTNLNFLPDGSFRIAVDGTWYYRGSLIRRPKLIKFFSEQINTSTLDPSFIGFIITGNFNFNLILFDILFFFKILLSKVNLKYLGVNILFFINISLEIILSIAIDDDKTPE